MLKSIIYICLSITTFSASACIPVSPGAYVSSEPLHHSNVVYTPPPVRKEVVPSFPNGYHRYDPTYLTPGEYSNYYWKHYNGYWYRHLRVKSSYEVYTPSYYRHYHRRYRPHSRKRIIVKPRVKIRTIKRKKHKGKKKWRKH
jgi:hypothetical protein